MAKIEVEYWRPKIYRLTVINIILECTWARIGFNHAEMLSTFKILLEYSIQYLRANNDLRMRCKRWNIFTNGTKIEIATLNISESDPNVSHKRAAHTENLDRYLSI